MEFMLERCCVYSWIMFANVPFNLSVTETYSQWEIHSPARCSLTAHSVAPAAGVGDNDVIVTSRVSDSVMGAAANIKR